MEKGEKGKNYTNVNMEMASSSHSTNLHIYKKFLETEKDLDTF